MFEDFQEYLQSLNTNVNDTYSPILNQSVKNTQNDINYDYDIVIINGNVVIPESGILKTNVFIKGSKIVCLSNETKFNAQKIVDAQNKYILPGIIDPHSHFGIFTSFENDLDKETTSALIGGITTIGSFINANYANINKIEEIVEKIGQNSKTDITPHLVINEENQIPQLYDLVNRFGIRSFKVYMNGIPGIIPAVSDGFILDVMNELKGTGKQCLLCVHCENESIVNHSFNMLKHQLGSKATIKDWTYTHPALAEEEAVMRITLFSEKIGVPVYLVHISSKEAIVRLKSIKENIKNIYVETTSPYLTLNKNELPGNFGKMEPPLRDQIDMDSLWEGIKNGTVNTIGTDNVSVTINEKNAKLGIWDTVPGYSVFGTHLASVLNEGVVKRKIPIEKIVTLMSTNQAKIFGLYPNKGTLLPGSDADIVIVDMDLIKNVSSINLNSRSDFSIYEGKNLQGWPIMTIKSGTIVAKDGQIVNINQKGKCILSDL